MLRALGHDVRLIAPQFVAPYRKGGKHVKNDALDAEAICEAASRPHALRADQDTWAVERDGDASDARGFRRTAYRTGQPAAQPAG
jgi:hypothetical protein